jgi:hypothetical protein
LSIFSRIRSDLVQGKFAYLAAIAETGTQALLQDGDRQLHCIRRHANPNGTKGMEQTHHESDKFH